jgi:hypothetical protein
MLDEWKAKYPKSELRLVRSELYLAAYESLGDNAKLLATATEMTSEQPDNLVGLYWQVVLAPTIGKSVTPELLGQTERAARRLLAGAGAYFSPEKKPAWMNEEQWKAQRSTAEFLAHRALGWAAWQQRDFAGAEKELVTCIQQKPNGAEAASWLGFVLALGKDPDRRVASLWQLARASVMRDEGALPEPQRRQVGTVLEHAYNAFHGSSEGLDRLRDSSLSAPFPPEGFTIESAEVIAARRAEEEFVRANPELAAWLKIRKSLDAADGDAYFSETLQGKTLPKLKGTLIRSTPARRPNMLVIGLSNPTSEEMAIKLSSRMPNDAEAGTVITFEATAETLTREPFMITVSADPDKIEGWPGAHDRK